MDKLLNLANYFKNLNIHEILNKVLANSEAQQYIIGLNTEDQLFNKHIDSEEEQLAYKGYRKGYSKQYYEEQGGVKVWGLSFNVGGAYDLKNSGSFYNSFAIILHSESLDITANPIVTGVDGSSGNLFESFGIEIVGLTPLNIEKLSLYLKPLIINQIRTDVKLLQ
jgi:hypothetical protein